MAHSRTARKAVRQNTARRARNRWRLVTMRDAIKELRDLLVHGKAKECAELFPKVSRIIDRTAARGIIHKNQAARRKSRLAAAIKAKLAAK